MPVTERTDSKSSLEDAVTLSEQIATLYNHFESCDVTFLVGKTQSLIRAHKAILAARSPVFMAMLFGPLKESASKDIIIPNIEPEAFNIFINYLYTSKSQTLTKENVVSVLAAANQYQVLPLVSNCIDFIQKTVSSDTVCFYLMQSNGQHFEIYEMFMQYFEAHAAEIIKTEEFTELSEEIILDLLRRDFVCADERDIFNSLVRWGQHKAKANDLIQVRTDRNTDNLKEVLQNVVKFVRMPLMTVNELRELVKPLDVVPVNLYIAALEYLASGCSSREAGIQECFYTSRFKQRCTKQMLKFKWENPGASFGIEQGVYVVKDDQKGWNGIFGDTAIFLSANGTSSRRRFPGQNPLETNILFFDIQIKALNPDKSGMIIGLASNTDRYGFANCFGYGGNGVSYPTQCKIPVQTSEDEIMLFAQDDIIGIRVDTLKRQISYWKNGKYIFTNPRYLPVGKELYPVVFMFYRGDVVKILNSETL